MNPSQPAQAPAFLQAISSNLARRFDLAIPPAVAGWALGSREMADIWSRAKQWPSEDVFSALLRAMNVSIDAAAADLENIPRTGPVLLAANHPHGLLDGLVAAAMLIRMRRDFRLLANSLLASIPEVQRYVLAVDPFGHRENVGSNAASLLSAYRHLKNGGALIAFPAGEVSSLQPGWQGVADRHWNPAAIEIAARANAPVVPLFLHGRNGTAFQAAGLIHPALRTALLGRELINKQSRTVCVSIGHRIRPDALRGRSTEEASLHVRHRVYALASRDPSRRDHRLAQSQLQTPVAAAQEPLLLQQEIDALPAASLMFARGPFAVYLAEAARIPACLREIGRLREIAFREAAEGTGLALDLDRFDARYRHLFLWNLQTREIAGAYRAGFAHETGSGQDLYSRTLFHYDAAFLRTISPGLELGRSFIRPEYQRQLHSLSYLWKGIGGLLSSHREIRYLFGPVSIGADYGRSARELIVAYFELLSRTRGEQWLKAQAPPRKRMLSTIPQIAAGIRSVAELSEIVADLDQQGRGIPVLLKHYMNLGARVVGFNVDCKFSNALDAMIILDLHSTDPELLRRATGYSR